MEISVHDNRLVSYTVNEDDAEIILETFFEGNTGERENTIIQFSGVTAYFFENHAIWLGTVIFDIVEVSTENVLQDNWKRFMEGAKYGWPGEWAETQEKARSYFKENEIKAFAIDSSCGMSGWVLAKQMEKYPR